MLDARLFQLYSNVFVIIFIIAPMSEANSNHHQLQVNSDSEESSEISGIPQLHQPNTSFSQDKIQPSGEYIRVHQRDQKLDEEAILEFIQKEQQQITHFKKTPKLPKKKAIKLPPTPSKKQDLNNIRKKWKAEMDKFIAQFKQHLKQQKTALDGKQKEYLLEFYKVLLDGIYELKELSEDSHNDLTSNQRKIINPEADFHLYLKELVERYNQAFREAKVSNKIFHIKDKWDPLIKNCKDETNLELRRKIIRGKIKPEHVLAHPDQFLMSEDAKLKEQKRKKLILNEAEKNFDKPLDASEEGEMSVQQSSSPNEIPEQLESFRSISEHENFERKISQEREKLDEYKQCVGDEPLLRISRRINELLGDTASYSKIMQDFQFKFQHS